MVASKQLVGLPAREQVAIDQGGSDRLGGVAVQAGQHVGWQQVAAGQVVKELRGGQHGGSSVLCHSLWQVAEFVRPARR